MRKKLDEIFGKSIYLFREYPMILLMSFLAATAFILAYDSNYENRENEFVFVKFGLVASLGISLLFAMKMLSRRIGKSVWLEIAAVLFLIFFYAVLPEKEKDFTEPYAFLVIPVFILSHLLVAFVAFVGRHQELKFWQYNKNLFINIFLTAIFTGVLTGGVELAILAVDKLFDFNLSDGYYLKTFYFLAVFGSSFIFLLFSGKGLRTLEKDATYPEILKFFTQYILIPLLLIYAVILYLYAAKIAINWELPRGWVSYLILAYAVVGILGLLLVHPLKQDTSKSWVRIFSRVFYYTLIPLIVLLFTAIFTRILEYGYTEPRYFVLILALWLSSVVAYFVFFKTATIKFIPISLFLFGFFALVFPYLNTFSVAKRSQKSEMKKVLAANRLLTNGKIDFNKKVSGSVADEVADKFSFLAERKENLFLKNLLSQKDRALLADQNTEHNYANVRFAVRNKFLNVEKTKNIFAENRLELVSQSAVHAVSDYDYLVAIGTNFEVKEVDFENLKIEISTSRKNNRLLSIRVNAERWDITPFIRETLEQHASERGTVRIAEISTEKEFGDYHLKVVFDNLVNDNVGTNAIYYNPPILLIRQRK